MKSLFLPDLSVSIYFYLTFQDPKYIPSKFFYEKGIYIAEAFYDGNVMQYKF